MWLALDIGNSGTKGGVFEGAALRETFRLRTDWRQTERTAPTATWQHVLRSRMEAAAIERVGIASVVPRATEAAHVLAREATGRAPVVVSHALRLPFRLAYETPYTLGADRLAAAAAAWACYGAAHGPPPSVVALDAGTAVTYEVVDRTGVYRGGAIGAGPRLVRQALRRGTAQLPAAPLRLPPVPVGRSTRGALQSGILYGFVDGARGMLGRTQEALGERPHVVATGGWSALLAEHVGDLDAVDPHLVLRGIHVLMTLNVGQRNEE